MRILGLMVSLCGLLACSGSGDEAGSGGSLVTGGASGGTVGGSATSAGGSAAAGASTTSSSAPLEGTGGVAGGRTTLSGGSGGSGTRTGGRVGNGGTTARDGGPGDDTDGDPRPPSDGPRSETDDASQAADAGPPDRPASDGAGLPSASSVLEAMRKANDFFVGRWPDPTVDIVTDKTRPSNLWTRAVYYEGMMALYAVETDAAEKTSLYDYAVRWGASPSHPWTLTYTSASTMTNNADNQACGQTYIDLYEIDPKPERIATIKANIDDMVARGTANVWTWIDAIQMAMPVFVRLGDLTSDTRYFDAMWALYANARNQQGGGLRNPADGMWWRDLHFTPGGGTPQRMTWSLHNAIPGSGTDAYLVAPNGKDIYWSRGNGWVMAALVRVLDLLPSSDSHRATYVADYQAMAAALLPLQRSDGFWNESLLDPSHCKAIGLDGQDGPETSGTALFAYGLAWGIRQGLLDSTTYGAALANAWQGLSTIALQGDGRLGYVQSTGDRPCTDSATLGPNKLADFDDYGVGAFLLAGSEVYRLANGS